MSSESDRRIAIQETARELREWSRQRGGELSQEAAERRVREAVVRGDQKRENNHK